MANPADSLFADLVPASGAQNTVPNPFETATPAQAAPVSGDDLFADLVPKQPDWQASVGPAQHGASGDWSQPPTVGPGMATVRGAGSSFVDFYRNIFGTASTAADAVQKTFDKLGDPTGGAPAAPFMRAAAPITEPVTSAVQQHAGIIADKLNNIARGLDAYQPSGTGAKIAGYAGHVAGDIAQLLASPELVATTQGTETFRQAIKAGDTFETAFKKGLIELGFTEAGGRFVPPGANTAQRIAAATGFGAVTPEAEHRALNAVDPRIAPDATLGETALSAATIGGLTGAHAGLNAVFPHTAPSTVPTPEVVRDNVGYQTPGQRIEPTVDPTKGPQADNLFSDLVPQPPASTGSPETGQPAATPTPPPDPLSGAVNPFADLIPDQASSGAADVSTPAPANTNAPASQGVQGGPSAPPGL